MMALFSREIEWSFSKTFDLKKDELIIARVSGNGIDKPLILRWTLYKKEGLVMLLKYDNIPYQFILYPYEDRKSFRLNLDSQNLPNHNELLIVFEGFIEARAKIKFLVQGDVNFEIIK